AGASDVGAAGGRLAAVCWKAATGRIHRLAGGGMKRLVQVEEAEVIAGFLRNEFYERQFDPDRAQFESLVTSPDLKDEAQNALRRALLFRRRGHMWRELPLDTQWWRVQPGPEDI